MVLMPPGFPPKQRNKITFSTDSSSSFTTRSRSSLAVDLHMFGIDQAHWLATQEIIIQTRRQPPVPKKIKRIRSSAPVDWGDIWPAPASSHDSSLSALERDLGFKLDGVSDDGWSDNEGPIVETPMGVVRPWPRSDGREEDHFHPYRMRLGTAGLGASTNGCGLPWDVDRELSPDGFAKPSVEEWVEDWQSPINGSEGESLGSDVSESPIVETPMGVVRATGMRRRLKRDRTKGDVEVKMPPGERSVSNEDVGSRSEEKASTKGLANDSNGKRAGRDEDRSLRTQTVDPRAVKVRPWRTPRNKSHGDGAT